MKNIYSLFFTLSLFCSPIFLPGQDLTNITDVTLTFTPDGGGTAITATANDPDGDGPMPFTAGALSLDESTAYVLSIDVQNTIDNVNSTMVINQNSNDFLFFFAFTDSLITDPDGDGNVDNRADLINYNDLDNNGLPIGLSTDWGSECIDATASGEFRVLLQYQAGVKSATSSSSDGTNEFDITWSLNVDEDPNAPPCENEEEIITDVTLTFTPTDGGDVVTGTAQDPDGPGPLPLQITQNPDLLESTEYEMSITLFNSIEGEDITQEIMDEDDEHMFFFAFTDSIFASPDGDGNTDNRPDPVNYNDFDENNLPVGLSTNWEASCAEGNMSGELQVILKHQPGIKSATSTVNDGGTDVDLTWVVNVIEDPNAPECENEEEIITDVTLTFTPVDGGDAVTAAAQDPDGPGPLPLQITQDIELLESTEYEMAITLFNSIEGEDITQEIMEEDDEHMFFFAFTDTVFASPDGDGNVDNRPDPVNYNDFDDNNLPVGLSTNWQAECAEGNILGSLQIILKHQPDIKSATSTVNDGGTDVDLTFAVTIMEDPDAPSCENEEEIITDVTLTFTPVDGGDAITAAAQDPDGPGPLPLTITKEIELVESTEYEMSITLFNSIEGEDITQEIMEEDDEHMFFFAFTDSVFTSPAGNGNVDNRPDPMNYNDFDDNNLPVGLSTNWEAECFDEGSLEGTLQVILKHQPDIKSETSTVNDGGTDVDLTWTVTVLEDPDAPPCENEEEIITDVTLTFTPVGGGDAITAAAQDPDGPGPLPLTITQQINLVQNTEYQMAITLFNSIEGEDITQEIMEEDDEHMIFFEWTEDLFSSPSGNGNADNRDDAVNYNDFDGNNLPVGLSTNWTTQVAETNGTFRLVLKHQPDIKTATSTINDGGTDVDLTFDLSTLLTSTEDLALANEALKLAPNPVSTTLNWLLEDESLIQTEVRIYDQLGRMLKSENQSQMQGWTPVDVAELPEGMYYLQVRSADKSWTQRFLKVM